MCQVLLVCDEPGTTDVVQTTLGGLGHRVETVPTEAEALAKLAEGVPPDLLIHTVPGGVRDYGLLRAVRRDLGLADLPVILLTATAWGPIFESYWRGRELYLTRPFNPAELVWMVKRLLWTTAEEAQPEEA